MDYSQVLQHFFDTLGSVIVVDLFLATIVKGII